MTTIAYKDGVMASDSKIHWQNNAFEDNELKIRRLASGDLIGIAGDSGDLDFMSDYCQGLCDKKDMPDNLDSYIIVCEKRTGKVYIMEEKLKRIDVGESYAIGSGMQYALAAMECGKTAIEAVKIASKFDPWTGGKIHWLELNQKNGERQ